MKKSLRLALFAVAAIALTGAAAVALRSPKTLPTVSYTLLDGRQQSSAELKGKVTLVNFWATDCKTCVHEMPALIATHQKFAPRGFETLAVSMKYDPPAYVASFAANRQLPFMVAIDNTGEIAKRFGNVRLTPTTFLVNKKGEIVQRYLGEPDFAELHGLIEKLLAES